MIIRSKYTDFYDFLAHQNRDVKVVYERKVTVVSNIYVRLLAEAYCYEEIEHLVGQRGADGKWKVNRSKGIGLLAVCGKLHPFYYNMEGAMPPHDNYEGFNDFDVSASDLEVHPKPVWDNPYDAIANEEMYKPKFRALYKKKKHTYFEHVKMGGEHPHAMALCREAGPIVLIVRRAKAIANVPLRLLRFPVNPHTIFQDISSFLMSVEPHIPEMDDITKRDAHGFDDKTFKREPGGPTRKRKKLIKTEQSSVFKSS